MADHAVKFTVPFRDLGRSDVVFKIYSGAAEDDEHLLGTLMVSHGALEWRSRKKHHTVRMDWDDFDRYMEKRRA